MLSGESANGKYPVESVKMMAAIASKTENWMPSIASIDQMMEEAGSKEDALAASAVFTAEKLGAGCLVVKGDASGDLSRLVAKYRPSMPILALVNSAKVARQLSIHRGVFPTLLPYHKALPASAAQGLLKPGDELVMVEVGPNDALDLSIVKAP